MKAIVESLACNYTDQGNGPALLLLHGWGVKLGTFSELGQLLVQHYRVIAVDLPGFGESQRPQQTWGMADYAHWLKVFCDKLGIQPDYLAGHSFGGRVAIKAVGTKQVVPQKLILIDSAGIKHDGAREKSFKYAAKAGKAVTGLPGLRRLRIALRRRLYKAAGSEDYLMAGPMREIFVKTIAEDLQGDAAKIAVPTLFIWGDEDTETPVVEGRQMAAQVEKSQFEVVADAGHFSYIDQPQTVVRLIEEFAQ